MSVSLFLKTVALLALLSTASAQNVVFIVADDLGYGELGCYGQEKISTPNIDQLAREGIRLTQHYSGAPTCAPSRCALLTGKHGGNAEIRGNRQASVSFPEFTEGQHPISENALTIASVLRKADYVTGAFGKWGLGPVGSTGDPNTHGFDLFYGYNCQAVAHSYYAQYIWKNDQRIEINPTPIPGHAKRREGVVRAEDWNGENYAPDLMLKEATTFILENRDKPFFLYLPFIEPHVAIHPPADRLDTYPSSWDDKVYRGENGYLPHPRPRAGYAVMISDLDRYVGEIRRTLDESGILDDTLIVFTSDNGTTHPGANDPDFHIGGADPDFFNSTGNLRGYKGSLHEGGIRVPAIVRWPGKIEAGTVSDRPSYFPDWFPTLCAAVGIEPPNDLDGINLLPTLTGKGEQSPRTPMVWVFAEYSGQVAMRLGDHKIMRTGILGAGDSDPWEVYDLAKDPSETNNLADSMPDLIAQAKDVFIKQWAPNENFPLNKEKALR